MPAASVRAHAPRFATIDQLAIFARRAGSYHRLPVRQEVSGRFAAFKAAAISAEVVLRLRQPSRT